MNRSAWTPEERDEFDAIVAESVESSVNQAIRTNYFLARIRDAEQAQRFFAADVLHDAERRGAASILKAALKANTTVLVSHEGKVLTKPRMIGTQRRDLDGRTYSEQTLFDYMTWDELVAKRREYLRQIDSYDANVATVDKLLALRDLAPEAINPISAVQMLGTTLERWLGEDEAESA